MPQLRAHIAAGRSKARPGGSPCTIDLTTRWEQLAAAEAATLGKPLPKCKVDPWFLWDEPQSDLANDLDNLIPTIRACVNCAPEDRAKCDEAESELRKFEATHLR